jgi:adenylate cyclase
MGTSQRFALGSRSVMTGFGWVLLSGFIALSGVLYMRMFSMDGAFLIGAIYALACSMPLIAFETGMLLPHLLQRVRRFSTPAFFLSSLAIYFVLSGLGFAAVGVTMKLSGLLEAEWRDVLLIRPKPFVYTLAFFLSGITIMRIRQLLGRQVFSSLLTGRYRHPIQEERIFLFIDVVGSTTYARQNGDLRAQEYLSEVFASFAQHVRRHGGEIDDYVGDCAIVTWPMKTGIQPARCIACLFDILDDLSKDATVWARHFGSVPQLSAALHGGSIVTAEIGVYHHKISYFGDVVNTTARIEGLCKSLGKPLLISQELLERLSLPANIEATPAGAHLVKGRDEPLSVVSLQRNAASAA